MNDRERLDPHDLQRFLDAQAPVIDDVRRELRDGRKRTHWMWFVFPQLRGLGRSAMAAHYGIGSRDEAKAYLAHPVLGPRLRECAELVNQIDDRPIHAIFGSPDDLKFRSCMTLFARVADDPAVFVSALERYFGAMPDEQTLVLLEASR